jgi:hypothetical protein
MRKGQIIGQVFIYILSVVIISAILIYGYTAVSEFRDRSQNVAKVKLQNDITNAISKLSSDYGSVQRKELYLGEYLEMCFVDNYEPSPTIPASTNKLIADNVQSRTGNNVFLIKETLEQSFRAGTISVGDSGESAVDTDVVCIDAISNRVEVRLEGKGDHVHISPWQ